MVDEIKNETIEQSGINFGEEFDTGSTFDPIDAGDYEVSIDSVEVRKSKKGNDYLNFTFRIRDDVDQKFKNRKLFYSVTKKEGDPVFDYNRINKIIITQKNTSNYKKKFLGGMDEILQYLHGLHMLVTVEEIFDEYQGKEINVVKDYSFLPSIWDMQDHSGEIKTNNVEKIDVSDELPF